MAQPETLVFHNLAEAEELRAGRQIHEVQFEMHAETSLNHAEEIDTLTRPGVEGFRLLNPELLDCKKRTKYELRKAYDLMRGRCLENCDNEIRDLDIKIAAMKQQIAIPNFMLPHDVGPPLDLRNQGPQKAMQLPPVYNMPNENYEMGPDMPFQPPFQDAEDIMAAMTRDEESLKAWWELNLAFLEERRKIAEEKKVNLERRLEAIRKKAVESRSLLGAGYHRYNFMGQSWCVPLSTSVNFLGWRLLFLF